MKKHETNSSAAPFNLEWLATNLDLKTHLVKRTKLNDFNQYEIEFISLEAAEDFKNTLEKKGLKNIRLWDFMNTIELNGYRKEEFLSAAQNTSPLDLNKTFELSNKPEPSILAQSSMFSDTSTKKEKLKTPYFTTVDDIKKQITVIKAAQNHYDNLTAWVNLFLLTKNSVASIQHYNAPFYANSKYRSVGVEPDFRSEKTINSNVMYIIRENIAGLDKNLSSIDDWAFLNDFYSEKEKKLVVRFLNLVEDVKNAPGTLRDIDILFKAFERAEPYNPYALPTVGSSLN